MNKKILQVALFVATNTVGFSVAEAGPKCPPQQADLCHELQVILDHAEKDGILAAAGGKWDGEHLYFDTSGVISAHPDRFPNLSLPLQFISGLGANDFTYSTTSAKGVDNFQDFLQQVGKKIADTNQILSAYGAKVESFEVQFTGVATGTQQDSQGFTTGYITTDKVYSSSDALAAYNAQQATVATQLAVDRKPVGTERRRDSSNQKYVDGAKIRVPVKVAAGSKSKQGPSMQSPPLDPIQKAPPMPRDRNGLNQQVQAPPVPSTSNVAPPIVNAYIVPKPLKGGKQNGAPVTHAVAPPVAQSLDPIQKAPPMPRDRNGLNQKTQVPAIALVPAHATTNRSPNQQIGFLIDRHKITSYKKPYIPDAVSIQTANLHHDGKTIDRYNLHQHFTTPKSGSLRVHNERAYLIDSEQKVWSCSISGMGHRSLKSQDGNINLHGQIEVLHFQRNSIAHVPANHPITKGCLVAVRK